MCNPFQVMEVDMIPLHLLKIVFLLFSHMICDNLQKF